MSDKALRFVLKPVVFALSLGPAAWLGWAALTDHLSANPLADLTNETGVWTLRFLALTLALTPLRRLTKWNVFARFRRMLGLFAFFYGTLHVLTYVVADRFAGLDLSQGIVAWTTVRNLLQSVGEDIYKRPFITVGFVGWIMMVPLALTSTAGMIRRLGGRRWSLLHRLVYATAIAGVTHYWWLVKADVSRPRVYAAIFAFLLAFRVDWIRRSANIVRQLTDRRIATVAAARADAPMTGADALKSWPTDAGHFRRLERR
jgi:methionine sulfoxide reductase heme-binding subunit